MQARIAAALGGTLPGLRVISAAPAGQTPAAPPAPTFTRDAAPILYRSCASCHRPGETAPMALLTDEDARPYARAIRAKVADGQPRTTTTGRPQR